MLDKIGKYTALISFLIGTLLLLIFYYTDSTEITGFGIYFIIIAGILNLIIIALLLAEILSNKENRNRNLKTTGLMLLNIPIVFVYFYFVMILLNTLRITFINETGKPISDIKIIGGKPATIEKLKIGESQTKWIGIENDNLLTIEYNINGEKETDTIFGYITSFSGQKLKYRIGKETKPIDEKY
jgi:hypothetical protein